MLNHIHVKNLALISEIEAELAPGLNVLSGETGAGKSIIIDSISFALGEKTARGYLREGAQEGLVELFFSDIPQELQALLAEKEITADEDGVVLTRKITGTRSVAKINGEAVSAALLKEAASYLIDIHGQHEHQSLLQESRHLDFLDKYGHGTLDALRAHTAETYRVYRQIADELSGGALSDAERLREMDLLSYELREIEEVDFKKGEDEELEAEYRRCKNHDRIFAALSEADRLINGSVGALELCGKAVVELNGVGALDADVAQIQTQMIDIDDLLHGVSRDIMGYIQNSDYDPERFTQIGERLDRLNRLKEKYGSTYEAVHACCEEKRSRLQKLEDYTVYMEKLRSELTQAEAALKDASQTLSQERRRVAGQMREKLTDALRDLNFLDVKFDIAFEDAKTYGANGTDLVRFMISTNPGEPLKELAKVASGGELSRIMLGLKSLMADSDEIETLIFDEIDTGISGETANKVAKKLSEIAAHHQVICITHLPQIASEADHHYLIEKQVQEGSTISSIRALSQDAAVEELARMIGGDHVTDAIRQSAREMKKPLR